MKLIRTPKTPTEKFEYFLQKIGGLKSGYYSDKPPIISNICECGEGWLPLIQECIEKLIKIGWNKEILQIKEKFGGLRFYTNGINDEMRKIIVEAMEKSYKTCEICGEEGTVRNNRWVRTLCDKHYKKDDE